MRNRKRRNLQNTNIILALILAVLVAAVLILDPPSQNTKIPDPVQPSDTTASSTVSDTTASTSPETTVPETTVPTKPPIVKESTATIGAVGDILMHGDVIRSGYDSATGTYNYDKSFTYLSPYISALDYAVANMEGTLCGNDNGYNYGGYPNFNAPDAIADALYNAGFDLALTANNHSYDTRSTGFHRTLSVLREAGLATTGTRDSEEETNYVIQDINGIRIGMICYTYNTGVSSDGSISLNGIPLSVADSALTNSFTYNDLDAFYDKLSGELAEMDALGAEATVLFIHWGDEYRLSANSTQKAMAQALCDLGVDVIIGGHAHVVEPIELLTSTVDETHKTVCLYSLGNAVSNQRLGKISSISTAHTEDGVMMQVTFAKYSDGTVVIEGVDLLPFWVNMYTENNVKTYAILPLDSSVSDWQSAMNLTDSQLSSCEKSYTRTTDIISEGLSAVQTWCAENQAAVEQALGAKE